MPKLLLTLGYSSLHAGSSHGVIEAVSRGYRTERPLWGASEVLGGVAVMRYQDGEQDMEHSKPDPPQIGAFLGGGNPQGLDM